MSALTAVVVALAAHDAMAQDAWVSPKDRPAGIAIGDRVLEPQGNLKLFDVVEIHPSFRQALLWDDNIFLGDRDTEGDGISTTTVGLRLDVLPGDFEFTAGTRYAWQEYVDNNDESHGDWFSELRAVYTGRVVRFALTDTLSVEEDPLNLTVASRLRRFENHLGAQVELAFSRMQFVLRVGDDYLDFDSPFTNLDHREDSVDVGCAYEFSEDRQLFIDYTFGLVDYEKPFRNDYTYHQGVIGLRGPVSSKLEGEAAFGWMSQDIREGRGVTSTEASHSGPTGRVQLSWSPTPRISARVTYLNALQFADTAAYAVVDRGELSVTWTPTAEINWRVYGWIENSDQPGSPPFLQTGVGTNFDWDWQPWLSTGLGVEYRGRSTDLPDGDYANIRAWWQLTLYL